MRAGLANERFELLSRTKEKNKYGKFKDAYITTANLAGDIQVVSARDRVVNGGKVNSEVITIRTYRIKKIDEKMHVKWDNNTYEIIGITPSRRKHEMLITAERDIT